METTTLTARTGVKYGQVAHARFIALSLQICDRPQGRIRTGLDAQQARKSPCFGDLRNAPRCDAQACTLADLLYSREKHPIQCMDLTSMATRTPWISD